MLWLFRNVCVCVLEREREIFTAIAPILCSNENEAPGKAICIWRFIKPRFHHLIHANRYNEETEFLSKVHLECVIWAIVKELSKATRIKPKRGPERNGRRREVYEHKICYYGHHLSTI